MSNDGPALSFPHDDDTLAAVDRWLEYRVWHSQVPGAQVAIGLGGEIGFSKAYGLADLAAGTPMRTDHLFKVASHSKTFTATLVLQLVDAGRVALDDPIGRYVGQLGDDPTADVRVRELLEHTSGLLRDGRDADYWQHRRPFPERAELLALVRDGGLKTDAGASFGYSNLGYSLLGLLIESVTATPYAIAVRDRLTGPLGLTDTAADVIEGRADDYAAGHSGLTTGATRHRIDHVTTRSMAAATGFTSTARDLVGWFGAHRMGDERILSDRTKRLQQRRANAADPSAPEGNGYGWGMVVDDVDDVAYVGHSGGYPGHITKTLVDPRTGLIVSVLTNSIDGPATALARGVVQLLTRAEKNASEGAVASDLERRVTGRYANDWGVIDLAVLGGRLQALHPTGWLPLDGADVVEQTDDQTLLITRGNGFGSVGEPVIVERHDQRVVGLRYGGMSMTPFTDLPGPADVVPQGVRERS